MPGILINGSASPSSSEGHYGAAHDGAIAPSLRTIDDIEYPAATLPGYAEKPLSEQLEPIAVIGMGCRLPGDISSPAEFWELMINKRTGQTPKLPSSRFNIDAHFHENNERPGSFNVLGGYFLNSDLQGFDPALFQISPIEAMWMDPQQRNLLEVVYESFESGGVTLEALNGSKTAVFIGSFTSDFQQMSFKEPDFRHSYAATGVDPGIISNRIGHVFNLNGPSITVNTACSSSVYAIHNACNALRNNECCAAIVGGTNLVLTVDQHMNTAKLGVLSPTSTCRTFDEKADGYGRADGIGAVYLKRFSDAVRDGDPIRGVIRSSAVNSNGRIPVVGITHPNLEGQEAVIRHAYQRGGDLDPRLTGYFECHGTGTPIGDPLEVHAVAKAMNDKRLPGEDPLMIGAVKTNIGHSEAASGLSALIKAVLTVEKGIIPPTRGLVNKNPKIQWSEWKVDVVTEPTPFPAHLPVKRVSVNSFGYGGTNAHLIIESAESLTLTAPTYSDSNLKTKASRGAYNRNRPFLLAFSAHDKTTLKRNIAAHSQVAFNYNLLDISYTLACRRSSLVSKGFVVANHANVESQLSNDAAAFAFAEKKEAPTIGFAFTGQGAQWAKMGSELMNYYPSFLRSIRFLDRALEDLPDGPEWTLEDTLLENAETSRVNEAEFSQPLCTAIQLALVQMLAQWNIKPVVTVGHSSGEIAAAYAAGLISAKEAIVAAYYRGKIVAAVNSNGSMMAVGLGSEEVAPYLKGLEGKVVIACHNSPVSVTLSGDAPSIETLKTELDAENIFARIVKTNGKAYHSHHMEAVAAVYEQLCRSSRQHLILDPRVPSSVKMVSSVLNSVISSDAVIDEKYWSANLRSPVLFNQAVQTLVNSPEFSKVDMLLEIGPHSALSGPIKQIKSQFGWSKIAYVPTLLRGENSAMQLLKVAGELFLRNYPLDMERVAMIEEPLPSGKIHLSKGQLLVDLPTYQWNYSKDLWAETRSSREHRAPKHARHDILGGRIIGTDLPVWRNVLRIRDVPWLKDHSLGGEAVFPAAGYFSMAMEAITQLNEDSENPVGIEGYVLRDVSIKTALVTPDDDTGIEIILSMSPSIYSETDIDTRWWDFVVATIPKDGRRKDHVAGTIAINARDRGQRPRQVPNLPQRASGKSWNQGLREVGFDYGPTFRDMQNIQFDGVNYAAAASTAVRKECGIMQGESRYVIHPGVVDSCLQLIIVSIYAGRLNDMTCGAVPIQVDEVDIWCPSEKQLQQKDATAFSWTDQRGLRSFVSGSELVAADGELLMSISDMRCTAYEAAVLHGAEAAIESHPYNEMVWKYDVDSLRPNGATNMLTVAGVVDLLLHKDSALKVIEIGSEFTQDILAKSRPTGFVSTKPTDELIAQLEAVFAESNNAKVQKLDLFRPLEEQDVTQAAFDLAIAPRKVMEDKAALENLRKLLVPGGRVVWDLDGRSCSALLGDAGFTSFDLLLKPNERPSVAISTAIKETSPNGFADENLQNVRLVYRKKQDQNFAMIKRIFEMRGWYTTSSPLEDCLQLVGDHMVVVVDLEDPLLATLEEKELAAIQNITNSSPKLLWVSAGGLLNGKKPQHALAGGLARSVRSENITLDFRTLDFDLDNTPFPDVAQLIVEVAEKQSDKHASSIETEYYVSNSALHISRLVPNEEVNSVYSSKRQEAMPTAYDPEAHLMGKVVAGKVIFEADPRAEEPIATDEVEVRVTISTVNKEDTLVVGGNDYPTTFSHEIGGVVSKVGTEVSNIEVGDVVVAFSFDKFATYQRQPSFMVQKVAEPRSLPDIVSLPMIYGAALYGLQNLASLAEGESVLVLEGTGMVGAAAIKVSQMLGAVPFVVVTREEDVKEVAAQFNLSERQVLLSTKASLSSQLRALTAREGVDVVFSSGFTSAHLAREAWRFIAPFGRFIDSGRKNVLKRSAMDTVPLHRDANYISFDILDLYKWRPQVLAKLLKQVVSLYSKHSIGPVVTPVKKNIAELDSAILTFSDHFISAKTLIIYEPCETPLNMMPLRPKTAFHPDASYLLVGSLGGLGRSLTSWMMKHGARRFVFLSRSGTDAKQAFILVEDLQTAGADVQVIRGDVTIKEDVQRAVASVPTTSPIRGVIQAAMVLRDGLFNSMSYQNWKTSTYPKVQGTWNLQEVLADTPLDFFVMTSSISGVLGTPAQSNYAAGNSFLDALARHRHLKSQKAISIAIPMVLGVGVVAENSEIEESLKRKGMYGIDEESLLELFEAAIAMQAHAKMADHIVGGMNPADLQKALDRSGTTASFWMEDARFRTTLNTMKVGASGGAGSTDNILATAEAADSPAAAVQVISEHFADKLSRMLLIDPSEFELDAKSVGSYGLDSMIGAELRNWIFKEYAVDIPFQQLVAPSLTITNFAKHVCAQKGIGLE